MTALFIPPIILLFVGIFLLSQLLIIAPLIVIACLILYMLKLLALVPLVAVLCAGMLIFGRKKVCKRCSTPEKKCERCGR